MLSECEHNRGSMFATGPCDECRNRLDGFRSARDNKQTKIHCFTQANTDLHKQRTFQVKWAAEHQVIPEVEEISFIPRITRTYKPILKHKASCIVMVHDS